MNKVRVKLRIGVIACLAAFAVSTVFASCEKKPDNPDNPDNPTGGETVVSDTFNIYVFGKESWTPFAGKSGVSFSNSDNNVLSITDNGTKVEFTGKQVGNSTITATLGDETKKALVKVRAMGGDETKKYITYNKPVKAYYIEYTEDGKSKFIAYENKEYCYSFDNYYIYIGSEEIDYSWVGNNHWYKHTGDPVHVGSWLSEEYKAQEYPLGEFAAYVSMRKQGGGFLRYGYPLYEIADRPDYYEMPNHTDVTEFYIRSEKVMDIMCDVYSDSETTSQGTDKWTWWIDPATGFTLKYEYKRYNGDITSYVVTKLVVGKPDWDGKHLRPKEGDTITNVD